MSKKFSDVAGSHDFEVVEWQAIRIKIFCIPRFGNRNTFPVRTRHVVFVEVDDNY